MDLSFLQHSIFLSALGSAILDSLWQSCILYLLYEATLIFYKNISAKIKHNVSLLFIFCSFIWFIGTFISKLFLPGKTFAVISGDHGFGAMRANSVSPVREFILYAGSILPYLSVAYIFLLLFLMIKLFLAYGNVYFISNKNLINPPSHLEIFSRKAAAQIGIRMKIEIWLSNHVDVPATIGFIKPIILIPLASVNHLTASQLEAIILHELSHIKRNDYFVNLMITVIETILFFNPFIVLFIKIIKRERENCCDDFVLQYQYDAHSYASALLQLEQSRKNNLSFALGAVSGRKQLLSRIKRIMGATNSGSFNYSRRLFTLLITTALLFSFACLLPSTLKNGREKMSLVKNDMRIFNLPKSDVIFENKSLTAISNIKTAESDNNKKSTERNRQENKIDNITLYGAEVTTEVAPPAEHQKHHTHVLTLEEFTDVPVKNLSVNIDYNQINEAIEQAYKEINTVNWEKVQIDIHKSISNINIEGLPKKVQAEIRIAIKGISKLKIDKKQFDALKFVQEMQTQKLMLDSLRTVGATLLNQREARLASDQSGKLKRSFKDSASGFSFNFDDRLLKINHLKIAKLF